MPDAEVREGVDHGVLDRRGAADRGRLADALGPEGVQRGRRLRRRGVERRELGRRGERVLGERRGDEVAVGVVADLLVQRLADARRHATVLLPLHEGGIDHPSAVVDRHVPQHPHPPRLRVDLHDAHVRAEREGGRALVEVEVRGESRQSVTSVGSLAVLAGRRPGEHRPVERAGGDAAHRERAVLEYHVGWISLEHGGREQPRLVDEQVARLLHGRAAELHGPRARRAAAAAHEVGVDRGKHDAVDRDSGRLADDHGIGRLVPLAVRRRPGVHGRGAVLVHLDARVLGALAAGRDLDVRRDPDADHRRVARLPAPALLVAPAVVAGEPRRLAEGQGVVAGVVRRPRQRRVRERAVRNQVVEAQLQGVDAEFVGGHVDRPLDEGRRLGPAGAPVGAGGRGVGGDRGDLALRRLERVDALQHAARAERQQRADAGVGPRLAHDRGADRPQPPVVRAPELDPLDLAAAVESAAEVLAARRHPAHRPAQAERERRNDRVLGCDADLAAEPAADLRRHDTDRLLPHADRLGEEPAERVGLLGRRVHEQAPVVRRLGEDRVRLERGDRDALVDEPPAHHPVARGEGGVDRGGAAAHRDVGTVAGKQQGRAVGQCVLGVDDRIEGVEVGDDGCGGVARLRLGLRDHHGDDVADEAHPVGRQRGPEQRGVDLDERVHRRQAEVGGEVDPRDAGHRARGIRVDAAQQRVGQLGPDEDRVQQAIPAKVVGVAGAAPDEGGILGTGDAGSEDRGGHGKSLSRTRRRSRTCG